MTSANVFSGSPIAWFREMAQDIAWRHVEPKHSNPLRAEIEAAFRDCAEKAWNAGRSASENAFNPFER